MVTQLVVRRSSVRGEERQRERESDTYSPRKDQTVEELPSLAVLQGLQHQNEKSVYTCVLVLKRLTTQRGRE